MSLLHNIVVAMYQIGNRKGGNERHGKNNDNGSPHHQPRHHQEHPKFSQYASPTTKQHDSSIPSQPLPPRMPDVAAFDCPVESHGDPYLGVDPYQSGVPLTNRLKGEKPLKQRNATVGRHQQKSKRQGPSSHQHHRQYNDYYDNNRRAHQQFWENYYHSQHYRYPVQSRTLTPSIVVGHPSFQIYRIRLPNHLLHLLDEIVWGCERHAATLGNGWRTNLYSLTRQDIALRDTPNLYQLARPISNYIKKCMLSLWEVENVKMDRNQPHVLKYCAREGHTGVELHHDKCDITANICLSRSNSYYGGG